MFAMWLMTALSSIDSCNLLVCVLLLTVVVPPNTCPAIQSICYSRKPSDSYVLSDLIGLPQDPYFCSLYEKKTTSCKNERMHATKRLIDEMSIK